MSPSCNIYKAKCEPIVPKGFETCFQCKGVGCFFKKAHYKQKYVSVVICPQCKGEGYIDWIAHARQVPKYIFSYSSDTKHIRFKCNTLKSCKVIKRWVKNNR